MVGNTVHKALAGACVFGEITAYMTADRLQSLIYLVGGIATFVSHFWWTQKEHRRKAKEQEQEAARRNREQNEEQRRRRVIMDKLAAKVGEDIDAGRGIPEPALLHLLIGPGLPESPDEAAQSAPAPVAN